LYGKGVIVLYAVLFISIILVLIILGLTIFAISSGYNYKHTVDELDGSLETKKDGEEKIQ
jgi:hypothetical protein